MVIWAALFLLLGEFDDFSAALYHSAVNFATLGYGDIVMSERWRLLGPLEAANGILMFGVSTAVMTAAVLDVVKAHGSAEAARTAIVAVVTESCRGTVRPPASQGQRPARSRCSCRR